jgi:hypothetical protein
MKSYKEWMMESGDEVLITEGLGEWFNNFGNRYPKAFDALMGAVAAVGIGAFGVGLHQFLKYDKEKHPENYTDTPEYKLKKEKEAEEGKKDDGGTIGGDRPGRIRNPHDFDPRSPFNSLPGQ